ncbi:MAG TPA: hypothetical protein VGK40_00240 [Verrucomicrobiae bacterium]|jgi:hypothetical protein
MLKPLLLLAQIDLENVLPKKPDKTAFRFDDTLVIVCAALGVALILFLWAYFIRKGRSRRSRTLARSGARPADREHSSGFFTGRRRRRRRRRDHPDDRPRNPTLGETGGLPPQRPDEPAAAAEEPTQ